MAPGQEESQTRRPSNVGITPSASERHGQTSTRASAVRTLPTSTTGGNGSQLQRIRDYTALLPAYDPIATYCATHNSSHLGYGPDNGAYNAVRMGGNDFTLFRANHMHGVEASSRFLRPAPRNSAHTPLDIDRIGNATVGTLDEAEWEMEEEAYLDEFNRMGACEQAQPKKAGSTSWSCNSGARWEERKS